MIYGAITHATERFDVQNAIGILARLISAFFIWLALSKGYGLPGLAVVDTFFRLFEYFLRALVAYRLIPGLRVRPSFFSRESARELVGYGIFSVFVRAAAQVIHHTDALVIGFFMSTTAVTYYAIANNLIPYFIGIIGSVAWTLTPYAASLDAKNDRDGLRDLMILGTQGLGYLASVIAGGLIFLGEDFLSLWMGEQYVSGERFASSSVILAILTCGCFFRLQQSGNLQILFGVRRVRFLAVAFGLEAVANLVLSILFIRWYGLLGVAIATLIPMVVVQGVVLPIFLMRALRVKATRYLSHAIHGPVVVLACMACLHWLLGDRLPADSWPSFVLKACIFGSIPAAVGLLLGLTGEHREILFRKLRRRSRGSDD
jgi:O-antigen/teichoic acid export membrane protein